MEHQSIALGSRISKSVGEFKVFVCLFLLVFFKSPLSFKAH